MLIVAVVGGGNDELMKVVGGRVVGVVMVVIRGECDGGGDPGGDRGGRW